MPRNRRASRQLPEQGIRRRSLREGTELDTPSAACRCGLRTLDEIRDTALATPRLTATLLAVFAALALLVTITGITGVIARRNSP